MKHGHAKRAQQSKEYRSYRAMLSRCYNPKNKEFSRYGGRGITVCAEWQGVDGFITFLSAMGLAPSATHSLDRKDPDGHYSPSNCRWSTQKEQCRNRRITQFYLGKTLSEWAEERRLNYSTLMYRWRAGLRGDELLRPASDAGARRYRPPSGERR